MLRRDGSFAVLCAALETLGVTAAATRAMLRRWLADRLAIPLTRGQLPRTRSRQ